MKISSRLLIIVILTGIEISLTLWSVIEISKGATFHQLNSMHVKYSAIFAEEVFILDAGGEIDTPLLKAMIENIRQQTTECLEQVNFLNKFIMKQIGTLYALKICEKDIALSNNALKVIDQYERKDINEYFFIVNLKSYARLFSENSALFEKPITETVNFVLQVVISLVIFISFFNIIFIIFVSRSITLSIKRVIKLFNNKDKNESFDHYIQQNVPGELKELLDVAKTSLMNELLVKEVNERLELIVAQRTLRLEQANRELEQFAYRTSHDLKAPLTSTKGLAYFIIEDIQAGDLENAKQDANKIIQQMDKLETLVIGILSLTKANEDQNQWVSINLENIIDEIKEQNSGLIFTHNCYVFSEINLVRPMVCEIIRIKQILENLVTNAIKYSDKLKSDSYVRINISETITDYVIEVKDNGIGIPEDRQGEVFEMFKRFHPEVSSGSGLGLSIVKKHIEALNGKVDLYSSKQGTVFLITFPKRVIL